MQKDIHTEDSPLDNKIVYQDSLPLSISLAQAADSLSSSEQRTNLDVLRAFWSFHETTADDLKEHPELHAHLERIELKLDMQSEMLAMLLRQSIKLPDVQSFSLGAEYFLTTLDSPYPVDSIMRIELFLLMGYPRPLVFFAKLLAQETVDGAYQCRFGLQGLDMEAVDLLEKILFRHHRRQIAHLRHKKP